MTETELDERIAEAEENLRFAQSQIKDEVPGSAAWREYKQMLDFWGERLDRLVQKRYG